MLPNPTRLCDSKFKFKKITFCCKWGFVKTFKSFQGLYISLVHQKIAANIIEIKQTKQCYET